MIINSYYDILFLIIEKLFKKIQLQFKNKYKNTIVEKHN